MILLTVGTQLPFDRLVRMVDAIAPTIGVPVIAQIGLGRYLPVNMEWHRLIAPIEFETLVARCDFLISHAGIGTLVMARKHHKPLILFPRLAMLHEHRNDHQLATVKSLEGRKGVYIAECAEDLAELLARPLDAPNGPQTDPDRVRLKRAISGILATEHDRWRSRS